MIHLLRPVKLKAIAVYHYLILIPQETFSRISATCSRLTKPTDCEARDFSKLFPGQKRVLPFDPNKELEGLPDRKKKKRGKTSVGCPINVSICRLSCYSPFIPKGKVRARLKDQGHIQTVQLSRSLTGTSVKKIINRAFQRIGSKWIYLETGQHNQLVISKEQCPHGNSVCSQRGCLYIVDQQLSLSLSLSLSEVPPFPKSYNYTDGYNEEFRSRGYSFCKKNKRRVDI